jgi:hypothetical protein
VRLDGLDPRARAAVLAPVHHHLAAGAQVDLRAGVAEPAPDVVGLRQQLPDALDRRLDGGLSLDQVRGHAVQPPWS